MSRRNENAITELLGVVLGSPDCKLEGWVAIARPVNIDINDDVAQLILSRPDVKSVSVFNLGVDLEKVDLPTGGSLASGCAFGKIDTLVCLNVLGSVDAKKRRKAVALLSRLLTPKGVAYFTRPVGAASVCKKARVRYFSDDEFKAELKGFFVGAETVESGNCKYPIIKCGGTPPL